MSVPRSLRHVEDLPVGPSWTAALNFLILLLSGAALVVWIGVSRDLTRYLAAPGAHAGPGRVQLSLGGRGLDLPRAMLRFPPPALLERDPALPYDHIELELASGTIATITPRQDVFTPAQRLEKIYRPVMTAAVTDAPDGLSGRLMAQASVYGGDTFYLADEPVAGEVYYVRCTQDKALAACYRTRPLADGLRLDYRFGAARLPGWREIETEIAGVMAAALGR